MIEFLWAPFLACLVLTGIHVYLGLHVLARGVIFVDLALAQVAALGITVAFLAGHPIQSDAAYRKWFDDQEKELQPAAATPTVR